MKVLLDVSVLGFAGQHKRARTGVYRVVDQYVRGLASQAGVRLDLCAAHSLPIHHASREILRQEFVGLPRCRLVAGWHLRLARALGALPDRVAAHRGGWRLQNRCRQLVEAWNRRLEQNARLLPGNVAGKYDIFHSPLYVFAPGANAGPGARCRRVLTLYDLIPLRHPEWFAYREPEDARRALDGLTGRDWVAAISEHTKRDLLEFKPGFPEDHVVVTPLAGRDDLRRLDDAAMRDRVLARHGLQGAPYFLSVCTLEPRKNLAMVVRTFFRLIRECPEVRENLVLVGVAGWKNEALDRELAGNEVLARRIIRTGYVDDEDLPALYSGATAFVYLSRYEGFGLPVLEAMQCGSPVIASNATSLPEVVGAAGVLLDPDDAGGLAQAMRRVSQDEGLRAALSAASLARAGEFSWARFISGTVECYRKACAERP